MSESVITIAWHDFNRTLTGYLPVCDTWVIYMLISLTVLKVKRTFVLECFRRKVNIQKLKQETFLKMFSTVFFSWVEFHYGIIALRYYLPWFHFTRKTGLKWAHVNATYIYYHMSQQLKKLELKRKKLFKKTNVKLAFVFC